MLKRPYNREGAAEWNPAPGMPPRIPRRRPESAARLIIAETTAKTHVARILIKRGFAQRAQGVMVGYESGLVEPKRDPDR